MKRWFIGAALVLLGAAGASAQTGDAPRNWLVDVRQGDSLDSLDKCGLSTDDAPLSGGMATLVCQIDPKSRTLRLCDIKDETVPGLGGRAVRFMQAFPQFAHLPLGKPVYANVCMNVAPPLAPGLPSDVKLEIAAPFQSAVAAEAVKEKRNGVASVRCTVRANGALGDCALLSELPTGLGFGDAALKTMAGQRVKPVAVKGKPVSTATVTESFYFGLQPYTAP